MKLLGREKLILFFITLFALGLRLYDINFLLPYFEYGPDERIFVDGALRMLKTGDLNPHFFFYGSLPFYLLTGLYSIFFTIFSIFQNELINITSLISHATFSSNNFALLYLGRLSSLFFGLGTILLTHYTAKELWTRETGYLAALFLTINPFHIFISQLLKVDSLLLFEILFVFYFSIKIYKDGLLKYYLWGGFISGLAISTKYMFPVLFPIIIAHFGSRAARQSDPRKKIQPIKMALSLLSSRLSLCMYISVFTFFLTSPYVFLDLPAFIRYVNIGDYVATHTATFHLQLGSIFYGRYTYQILFLFPMIFGPFLYVTAICGLAVSLRSKTFITILILSYPISYFLISGAVSEMVNFQYQLPILPFACLTASFFVFFLLDKKDRLFRNTGFLICLLTCFWSASNLLIPHVKTLFSTYEAAGKWMAHNIPREDRVLTYFWVFHPTEQLDYPNGEKIFQIF